MPTSGTASFSKSSTSISSARRKPFLFLSNLWRRKKVLEIDDIIFDRELNHRTRSEPSVISYSCTAMHKASTPSASLLTMTPGRCREIDQDMHALRLSRQDNPFVQKVLASRESLIDTLDDTVSDDAVLMASQELSAECDGDPFALPEVQEHMIRSPPPTSWPRSPQYSMFPYNNSQDNNLTISSHSSDDDDALYNHHSIRAQDLFLRTTSVPAGSQQLHPSSLGGGGGGSTTTTPARASLGGAVESNNGGLNIALSRPKSNSVNMPRQLGAGGGAGQPFTSSSEAERAARPKCLYDGPLSIRSFNK